MAIARCGYMLAQYPYTRVWSMPALSPVNRPSHRCNLSHRR